MANKIQNIKHLSELAGVSVGSASMVMGGKWEKKVKPAIAEKILRLARENNYRVNPLGRSLQLKQFMRIAIIIHGTFKESPIFRSFSFHEFIATISDVFSSRGYAIDIIQLSDADIEVMKSCGTIEDNADALIFVDWSADDLKDLLNYAVPEKPYIAVGVNLENKNRNYIYRDTEEVLYKAASLLLRAGHKRVAIAGIIRNPDFFDLKVAGYKRALIDAGIRFDPDLYISMNKETHSFKYGLDLAKQIQAMVNPPTAIICDDNIDAIGLILGLRELGIKVPEGLEIISYGDESTAFLATQPLSYIKIPTAAMAELASRFILSALADSSGCTVSVQKKIPETLILQSTTKQ
jgi:LacI family transcriptional regulator